VETTTGTPVEIGGKAPYFFSKTTGKLHFCAVLNEVLSKNRGSWGRVGLVSFRVILEWVNINSWVGKNSPGFVWSSIGVRIGLVDFHQITTLKPLF
jgi:hypothetical protein